MSKESSRYQVQFKNLPVLGGSQKAISLVELGENGNRLTISRGFQTDQSALEAKDHPRNVIYLDGAAEGPCMDTRRNILSLDHHAGSIREITLATCEQALRFSRTRVIDALGQTVIGNDPDLDTVLAGWAVLNSQNLAHDDRVFRRVRALFSLAGNIDALGLGYEELTGLPDDIIAREQSRINWLMDDERRLKSEGRWTTIDFVDYTLERFEQLDTFAFYSKYQSESVDMNVHTKAELGNSQTVDFIMASNTGIYEVEKAIRKVENSNTTCIIFTDGKGKWTIKLVGLCNPFTLAPIWNKLNELEQNAKKEMGITDERLLDAKWGGASGIGGPPRYYNGSGPLLSKEAIVEAIVNELELQLK